MNNYWNPSDDYEFAVTVKERLPKILSELYPNQSVVVEKVTIPSNEPLLQKYLLTDCDDEMEMLFVDDDDESRFVSPDDLPSEISYVRVVIDGQEYAVFYDEFGLNVDFCPCVHVQHCYSKDTTQTIDDWKSLSEKLNKKAESIPLSAGISYSADEICAVEDIIDSAPFIAVTVPIDIFSEKPETTIKNMFLCFMN